jgi:murein DD-endopeptidase MepM/ murein hydrolase activator NlpD
MSYINPLTGRVTSKFGNRPHPITKKTSFHNGVDIAAVIGTKVVAPAAGTITEAWEHDRGGYCMAMLDDKGVRFGFAHLNDFIAKKGQKVKAGEVIALSGNTGASTGPHLHFTVKVNGQWVDPLTYFTFK